MHPTRSDDSKASKQSGTNNAMQQFFKGFPSSKRCGSCEEMENRVMAMQADMEYLRSASLRNEFVCRDCQNVRSRKDDSGRLIHASDRIAEMNTRHVEQVQQMTKERVSVCGGWGLGRGFVIPTETTNRIFSVAMAAGHALQAVEIRNDSQGLE
jgi:hypothetical protein